MPVVPLFRSKEFKVLAKGWGGKSLIRQRFYNALDQTNKDFDLWGVVKEDGSLLLHGWSTIIMALTEKQEVITVKQFRFGANQVTLEAPGGNPDSEFEDNTPQGVGVRELAEETGYTPRRIIQLAPYAFLDPASLIPGYYPHLALDCYPTPEKKKDDPNEQTEVVLIPIEKYLEMAFNGKIIDSKTGLILVISLPHILGLDAKKLIRKILT